MQLQTPNKITTAHVWALLFFVVTSLIFCRYIFYGVNNWGILDWDQHFLYHAVPHRTIMEYHQFPLWNPYYCGGNVMLANPQSNFLSPLFLPELLFGVVIGLKLEIWLHLLIGMYGMYLISSRLYKLPPISSLVPATVFMLSGMYSFNLAAGQTNFMSIAYVPFVYYFFIKGIDDIKYAIISGYFLALMVFEGGTYTVPHTALFVVVISLLLAIQQRRLLPLRATLICGITGCLVSAVKLLPALEFIKMIPRYTDSADTLTPELLYRILFDRVQYLSIKGFPGQAWGWEEYAHYVGFLPLLLAIAGILLLYRKEWPLIITGLFFLVLSWGNFSDLSPWNILHQLPLFKSQRVPSRFLQMFVFVAAIFSGFASSKIETFDLHRLTANKFAKKWASLLVIALIVFIITLDLTSVNSGVFSEAFPHQPPEVHVNDFFRQVVGKDTAMYLGFLENRGTIACYEEMHLPTMAIPLTDQMYKNDEAYLVEGAGRADVTSWSPNGVTVQVNGEGILLLNQNYAPGWRTKEKKDVISYKGVLATHVTRDDKEVTFYYFPATFLIGMVVTVSTILTSILLMLKLKNRRPRPLVDKEKKA